MRGLCFAVALLASGVAQGAAVQRPVTWEIGGAKFEGVLVWDDASRTPRPGIVAVPNWMGVTPANVKQAQLVAGAKYVVLLADVYGQGARPRSGDEAGKLSGALKADRGRLRERVAAAHQALLAQAKAAPIDAAKTAAIGFCFGGTAALELARSGAAVRAVVSFHGGLSSPAPADAKRIRGRVLALHGADDPFVPPEEVKAFEDEMRGAGVDWQLVKLGGAVHGFTDTEASVPGRLKYDATAARRAYRYMDDFFAEAFGG